jgi:hypothetical protein
MILRILLALAMIGGVIYASAGLVIASIDPTSMLTGITIAAVALGGYGLVEWMDR